MEFIPDYHLEDWDEINENTFERGKLRITIDIDRNILEIKDSDGIFREMKEIDNYWEFRSLDNYFNADINTDQEDYDYQHDYFMNILDSFQNYDYVIIDSGNNMIYGHSGLFDDYGNWIDMDIRENYLKGNLVIIDVSTDIVPVMLKPVMLKGELWGQIPRMTYQEAVVQGRDNKISEVLNI